MKSVHTVVSGSTRATTTTRLQQFSCDHCERMIPRSEPVQIVSRPGEPIMHFCKPTEHSDCKRAEELQYIADLGGMYD